MDVITLPVGDLETNGYILHEQNDAVVIDPGAEPNVFIRHIQEKKLEPLAILITHGHADHIGAVRELRSEYPAAEVVCHPLDAAMLNNPDRNLSVHFGAHLKVGEPTQLVDDGDTLEYGSIRLCVIHIPGHTRGQVVFYHEAEHLLFAGDTLFADGIGRWDFPGGDGGLLIKSIREKLLSLPGDTTVYPGHGPSTTLAKESETNPYLNNEFLRMFGL